ncbi:SusC/RagA family TonB-linked outer membrane protein [Pedobacter sp.]
MNNILRHSNWLADLYSQKLYNLKRVTLLLFLTLSLTSFAFAQSVVKGTVTDTDKFPLAGVTVQVVSGTAKTQTDADGKFTISVPSGTAKLTFSYVGQKTQTVSVDNRTVIDVILESTNDLDGVQIVGYATVKKNDLTGSVATVSAKDFNKGPVVAPDQLIQGKVSGVMMLNNSGQPGGPTTVRIRGNSAITGSGQPLYVLDGVALDGRSARPGFGIGGLGATPGGNPLSFINAADIESIEVLKDASATAIYGARAAYGVVVITTKKGKNNAINTDLTASTGISTLMRSIDVMDAGQYRDALRLYNVNGADFGNDVDAVKEITRTAHNKDLSLSMKGGTDRSRFRLSFGYQGIQGVVKKSDFDKYTAGGAGNFLFLENKKLGLDVNLVTSQVRNTNAPISNNAGYQGSVLGQALSWNPTRALYNADGSAYVGTGTIVNPVAMLDAYSNKTKETTVLASFSPYYKIAKGLEYRMIASVFYATGGLRASIRNYINLEEIQSNGGLGYVANNELSTFQNTHTLNYNTQLAHDLSLNAIVGFEYMKYTNKGTTSYAFGFDSTPIDYTNILGYAPTSRRFLTSFDEPKSELQSQFARAILNYKDKYLFTATFRIDGSTKFGDNNKYGYFPSFSAAWNINRENFFKVDAINLLKLRAGWGKTGNQEFPAGASQERYATSGPLAFGLANNANENLKWQADEQVNVGLDYALFSNRITGSIDYFSKKTTDLLYPRAPFFPSSPAAAITWVNLPGIIKNSGLEFSLSGKIAKARDFSWDMTVNATFLKNKVSGMENTILTGSLNGQGLSGVTTEVIQNGLPLFAMVTRKFEGLDANGFSVYTDGGFTSYYVGNPNPSTLLGISSSFGYKKFTFTANMNGAFGQDIYNNTANSVISISNLGARNIATSLVGGAVKESLANPIAASSRYIERGSYLKMANATLSYKIGDVGRAFKNVNVSVTGANLFVITKFTGFDPEVNVDKNVNGVPSAGIEYIPYPTARTFTFGVNLSL